LVDRIIVTLVLGQKEEANPAPAVPGPTIGTIAARGAARGKNSHVAIAPAASAPAPAYSAIAVVCAAFSPCTASLSAAHVGVVAPAHAFDGKPARSASASSARELDLLANT